MTPARPPQRSRDDEREAYRRQRQRAVAERYFAEHPDDHLVAKVRDQSLTIDDAARILEESARDSKTGVQKADILHFALEYDMAVAREHHRPLSVAIVDLDHFKRINEELTHVGADQLLRDVVRVMSATVRASDDLLPLADRDVVTRWGGEEFVIVLTDATMDQAREVAERIRHIIDMSFQHRRPHDQPVTVSIGVAQYDPDRHPSAISIILTADEQLFAAKTAGRNCVRP